MLASKAVISKECYIFSEIFSAMIEIRNRSNKKEKKIIVCKRYYNCVNTY